MSLEINFKAELWALQQWCKMVEDERNLTEAWSYTNKARLQGL